MRILALVLALTMLPLHAGAQEREEAPRSSSVVEDPAFWIIAVGAALAIGGAIGAGVYAATEPSGYAGTIGIRFDI